MLINKFKFVESYSNPKKMINPEKIVQQLCETPHRGNGTIYEASTINYLSTLFDDTIEVKKELFRTPKTYISVVWWLIGGISFGLVFSFYNALAGAVIATYFIMMAMLYFNWYASPIIHFPPLIDSNNLIFSKKGAFANPQFILMAHYDTAPVSFIYKKEMVGSFRKSLIVSLVLMLLAGIFVWVNVFYTHQYLKYTLIALSIYFIIQGVTSTIDFFRKGYTQGASDNATGVAAAIATAQQLWKNTNLDIELVLTGAEEAGMIGAKAYFDKHQTRIKNAALINFDTLGNGNLKVITETGSLFNIAYKNHLAENAKIMTERIDFQDVEIGKWHTADFDSVWFQRAGMDCLTLAALDDELRMPNIHRPEDILENVDFRPMHRAICFATELVRKS